MSARRAGGRQRAERLQPHSWFRSCRRVLLTFIAMLLLAGGVLLWQRSVTTSVPRIEMTNLDPAVASRIQAQLDEVRSRPRSGSAWGKLGLLLRAYHFPGPALESLAQAERLDPHNPRWPYFQSHLLAAEAPAEAMVHLRRAVELCGNDPEMPRLRLATLLAEAGQWIEADREIQQLLRSSPEFTPALLLSARHAQAGGKIEDAIALARRCVDDPRTTRGACLLLAGLLARQGETNAAGNLTRRLAALPPDQPVADVYEAEAAPLRLDPRLLTSQTHALLAAGRLKEAEPIVDRLVREHPDYAECWLLAGRFHFLKKNFDPAEQCLRRHLQLDAQSSQGWFQLGLLQLAREHFSEAAGTFLRAIELKPDFGAAFYNRGFALARSGDLRQAAPAFREAIRLNPERIDSYLMLAEVALRSGEKAECLKFLREAEALNPNHPGVLQLREKAKRISTE